MHSVLFLILAFFNAAGLFVLLGAEFLAMILVVVYVGAVAVLFLFVVMMLDVDFAELREGFLNICRSAPLVGLILLVDCCSWSAPGRIAPGVPKTITAPMPARHHANTEALGHVLYTRYVSTSRSAGLILLVAMIGAIVLTLRHKPSVKRQNIARAGRAHQGRAPIEIVKVHGRGRGIGENAMTIGLGHYLVGRRDPVHARHLRHLSQPQERHRHPDVDRADPARRQHQPRRLLGFLGDLVGQVFALFVLTVAAGEAAIGLAILVAYFRNRGSIAVEDINLMKG